MKTKLFFIAMSLFALIGCEVHTPISVEEPSNISMGTFKDPRDGYTYKTVTIGGQTWLAENLRYCPNAAIVDPYVMSSTEPCYYIYNTESEPDTKKNFEKYGIIYNYKASQEAVPSGWRLPTSGDFYELISTVRSMKGCYKDEDLVRMLMILEEGTNEPYNSFAYANSSGFSGLYCRYFSKYLSWDVAGSFRTSSAMEYWIKDTQYTGIRTFEMHLDGYDVSYLNTGTRVRDAIDGFPIRCIKK